MRSSNCTHGSIGPRTTTTKTAQIWPWWCTGTPATSTGFTPNQTSGRYAVTTSTYAPPLPLLGHDMRASVSAPEAAVLATRATQADHDLLAQHFAVGRPG